MFEDCLQLWVYKCIQQFMFLIPKISRHPFYPKVLAAHQESQGQHMLHLVSETDNMQQVQKSPDRAYLYTIHSFLMCPCCMQFDLLPCCKHNGVVPGRRQCLHGNQADLRLSLLNSLSHSTQTQKGMRQDFHLHSRMWGHAWVRTPAD